MSITPTPRRSDARANRARVLAAAVECFTEDGMDTQMMDIARCAGVGIGTVYRHFPSKDALVAALATDCLNGLLAKASVSLEDPDAWHGLTEFVWYATERQATDRIAAEAATAELRGEAARCGGQLFDVLVALVLRAQEQGSVRSDIAAGDVVLMLKRTGMSLRGWQELGFDWRGYVTVVLDGLRTEAVRG
jgi:AcrR family transcriptional regulator